MMLESNISASTRRNMIVMLYRHARQANKKFYEITHEDMTAYLQSLRNSQDEAQKWIGTYNLAIAILQKFYKWLYYPNISSEMRALPECVSGFKKIRRKELARYSPNDMWTMEEHATFLKYCPSVKVRAYHAMALDTSARPHELLKLNIKDLKERLIPSVKDNSGNVTRDECVVFQFVVSGKTGSRALALTNSMPYVKKWLEEHPQRQNKDAFLFINKYGNAPARNSLFQTYMWYKNEMFPKLLKDQNVPLEDRKIIQRMLEERKWNPYVIRHSALTLKAKNRMMSDTMLRQHAGWSKESKMPSVYIHNYGSESVDELLRIQGYLPREDNNFDHFHTRILESMK